MPNYSLINPKMLQVEIAGDEVFARRGAMVAYTGEVSFAPTSFGSEGAGGLAMRTVTNERIGLMRANGRGTVLYARRGLHITIVPLTGETFFVESESVLAYDARLRAGTMFMGNSGVQGLVRGAATGAGLWTTTFDGRGELAILSEGDAIELSVSPEKPVCVDPQAYVGHRGALTSQLVTDVSWKTMLGQGSGESFQLKFSGAGAVYVQASER